MEWKQKVNYQGIANLIKITLQFAIPNRNEGSKTPNLKHKQKTSNPAV